MVYTVHPLNKQGIQFLKTAQYSRKNMVYVLKKVSREYMLC